MNPLRLLRDVLDRLHPYFDEGGKFEKMYPLYEAIDTFLFSPGFVTKGRTHVRDNVDQKRIMITVGVALGPCVAMALYNIGYQANLAMSEMGIASAPGWRGWLINLFKIGYDHTSIFANVIHGLLYFAPVFFVCNAVGGFWEILFATIRKHEINEGFLVTGLLFPLTLPPTIPLWQVAVGISFGVVIGKEIFGGTGKNFLNPALTARAFVFFAYPAQMSGDAIWTAVDGFSGATPLGIVAADGMEAMTANTTWTSALVGNIQGSMGETSVIACLIGATFLLYTGIGSWRIMLAVLLGGLGTATLLYLIGSETNPMFGMNPAWHMVLGGFAFGLVFMATDPVSAAMTQTGQWIYGVLIGFMVILIRVINPAYPEGMMLAILFGNVFAPAIDALVVRAHIKKGGNNDMAEETVTKTFLVAGLLAVGCSALVSSSAVILRPEQIRNKDLDRKKNILEAAGLYVEEKPVEKLFEKFETKVVEIATGTFRDDIDPTTFDQRKASRSDDQGIAIPEDEDLAGIKRRSQFALIYMERDENGILEQLILPVHGKGLWSTLYGYLALDSDLTTINGFAFYEHGETPGLGGEVDNPRWKQQWIGKKAFSENGEPQITVLKGKVNPDSASAEYQIDGLAGATITSRGVDALLKYWLGKNGFKPLLDQLRSSNKSKE